MRLWEAVPTPFHRANLRRYGSSPPRTLRPFSQGFMEDSQARLIPMTSVTEHVRAARFACRKSLSISAAAGGAAALPLKRPENDGIVNTASMFWPKGDNVVVAADHLDVVGHYKLVKTPDAKRANSGWGVDREYQSYDILRSTPHFTKKLFTRFGLKSSSSLRMRRVSLAASAHPISLLGRNPVTTTNRISIY